MRPMDPRVRFLPTSLVLAAGALVACTTFSEYSVPGARKIRDDGVWDMLPTMKGLDQAVRAVQTRNGTLTVDLKLRNVSKHPIQLSSESFELHLADGAVVVPDALGMDCTPDGPQWVRYKDGVNIGHATPEPTPSATVLTPGNSCTIGGGFWERPNVQWSDELLLVYRGAHTQHGRLLIQARLRRD